MDKRLRAILEQNGLHQNASETEAWALYDKLRADGFEFPEFAAEGTRNAKDTPQEPSAKPEEKNTPANPEGTRTADTPALDPSLPEMVRGEVQAQRMAEMNRIRSINEIFAAAGLGEDDSEFTRSLLDDPTVTADQAAHKVLDHLKARAIPLGAGARGAQVGTDTREKRRAAMLDGLCLRSGIRVEEPADGAAEFRGRSLLEIIREDLEIAGVNTRSLSRREIAGRALSSRSASTSTSDFPLLFSSLVNRRLLQAYQEWPATWRPFVAIGEAVDFRDIHAIKFSSAPDLKGLTENGEYQQAKFSEAGEKYRVVTKGIKIPLTREMIINDDLRAFTRVPGLFGVAARRMEADAVYSLITSNGKMSDGKPLFHKDHNNLDDTPEALTSAALGRGRAAMRLQKGLGGEVLDIQPAFLLHPVAMELDAEILLRSAALPKDGMSSGVFNPWANRLTPIADPHLDADSASAWYLLASPSQMPCIEVAYLEGEEAPYVEQQVDFNSDALVIKVRHDFGAGVVDHVGIRKNAGA